MKPSTLNGFVVAIAASFLAANAVAEPAHAADEEAARLFEDGRQLMADGNYPFACAKLAASLRLDPGIGTMLYLADCFDRNGQTASAWEQFRAAAAAAARVSDGREKVARARAAGLEPKLSTLTILFPGRTRGPAVVLARDDLPVDPVTIGQKVPLDPGRHFITASTPRKKAWSGVVDLPAGGASAVIVVPDLEDLRDAAEGESASTRRERSGEVQRGAGLAVFGAGILAVGLGTYLGLSAKAAWDNAAIRCPNTCDALGFEERTGAQNLGRWATGTVIGGALGVAAGAVLFLTAPRMARRLAWIPAAMGAGYAPPPFGAP